MKQLLIFSFLLLLSTLQGIAQSVPEGMRFQAVARDLEGNLLKQLPILIQVELFASGAREKVFYTETHSLHSNELGLVDLVIGNGDKITGRLSRIPWGKEEMWVRISVKSPGEEKYQIVTSGQLYSVPYAQYAETTSNINADQRTSGTGQNSILWTLEGNNNAQQRNNGTPVLGTTDGNDLVIITNNTARCIIDQNGMVNFLVDVDVDGALNADGATTLNNSLEVREMSPTTLSGTLVVDKPATLNDDLSVQNMAPTNLSGTLDVDGSLNVDGASSLNNTLQITGMHSAHLTGSLSVTKETEFEDDLTVENAATTHLTGDLQVDGNITAGTLTVNDALIVTDMHPASLSGTLTADQLASLNNGLVVNGPGNVGPNSDHLAYFNNTDGSGDGIAIRLANEDINKDNNYMTFYREEGGISGRIEGYNLNDLEDIPLPTTDEIWSAVCIGIADYNPLTFVWTQLTHEFNLFAAGWNSTTIPEFEIPDIPPFTITDVPALTIPDVPAFVITDVPGFSIPDVPGVVIPNLPGLSVGPFLCTEICFCPCTDLSWDCCCEDICLIPAEFEIWPDINIPDFPGIAIPDFPGIAIPDFPGIPVPDFPGIPVPDFPGLVIPSVPEIDFAEMIGECPTIPTFSDILIEQGVCPDEDIFDPEDGYVRRLAEWAFEYRLHSLVKVDPLSFVASALTWGLTNTALHNGIVYGSKGADYAEYLPKLYPSEQFMKGEVVGVHNGRISKNTADADQILAITSQPIVLGNLPAPDEETAYEKVAFLGQVPVFVLGPVNIGDYIVASGKNDGMAIACTKEAMNADMLPRVLGTAWSGSDGQGMTLINTSIGLRPIEITQVLQTQVLLEVQLQEQVDHQRNSIDDLMREVATIKKAVY